MVIRCRLTYRCGNRCRYCDLPNRAGEEMPTEAWIALFSRAARFGTVRIVFDGGEPLLRADIAELARAAMRLGIDLSLNTNGTAFSRHLDWLSEIRVVMISLDGDERVHEALRKGSHTGTCSKARGRWSDTGAASASSSPSPGIRSPGSTRPSPWPPS